MLRGYHSIIRSLLYLAIFFPSLFFSKGAYNRFLNTFTFLETSAALRNVPMIVIWDGTSGRSLPEWELSKDVQCMIAVGFHCFVVVICLIFFLILYHNIAWFPLSG